jgi:hypothetical protein
MHSQHRTRKSEKVFLKAERLLSLSSPLSISKDSQIIIMQHIISHFNFSLYYILSFPLFSTSSHPIPRVSFIFFLYVSVFIDSLCVLLQFTETDGKAGRVTSDSVVSPDLIAGVKLPARR